MILCRVGARAQDRLAQDIVGDEGFHACAGHHFVGLMFFHQGPELARDPHQRRVGVGHDLGNADAACFALTGVL